MIFTWGSETPGATLGMGLATGNLSVSSICSRSSPLPTRAPGLEVKAEADDRPLSDF